MIGLTNQPTACLSMAGTSWAKAIHRAVRNTAPAYAGAARVFQVQNLPHRADLLLGDLESLQLTMAKDGLVSW